MNLQNADFTCYIACITCLIPVRIVETDNIHQKHAVTAIRVSRKTQSRPLCIIIYEYI